MELMAKQRLKERRNFLREAGIGAAKAVGLVGLLKLAGCTSSYATKNTVGRKYRKLEKRVLENIERIANKDPNDSKQFKPESQITVYTDGSYSAHYICEEPYKNIDIIIERPVHNLQTLNVGIRYFDKKSNDNINFTGYIKDTEKQDEIEINLEKHNFPENKHEFIKIEKIKENSQTKISKIYKNLDGSISISAGISVEEMQKLTNLIERLDLRYMPISIRPEISDR